MGVMANHILEQAAPPREEDSRRPGLDSRPVLPAGYGSIRHGAGTLHLGRHPVNGAGGTGSRIARDVIRTILDQRYEILSLIGQGHSSLVYKADHMLMGRTVAIKVLNIDLASNPQSLKR